MESVIWMPMAIFWIRVMGRSMHAAFATALGPWQIAVVMPASLANAIAMEMLSTPAVYAEVRVPNLEKTAMGTAFRMQMEMVFVIYLKK
jgi:hypothetical protein